MQVRISDATKRRAATSAFRTMERVAPPLAGRTAAHLFFHVGHPPTEAKRRKHEPAGGEEFTVGVEGRAVRGMAYGPESGSPVYLVHGWAGWWQQLSALVEPLVDQSHRVIGYDALAHGASDGGRLGGHPHDPAYPASTGAARGLTARRLLVEPTVCRADCW